MFSRQVEAPIGDFLLVFNDFLEAPLRVQFFVISQRIYTCIGNFKIEHALRVRIRFVSSQDVVSIHILGTNCFRREPHSVAFIGLILQSSVFRRFDHSIGSLDTVTSGGIRFTEVGLRDALGLHVTF